MRAANDPFADIRDKRLSRLNDEQKDRAMELWARQNWVWEDERVRSILQAMARVIDRLREKGQG